MPTTVNCEKGTITPKYGIKDNPAFGPVTWLLKFDYTTTDKAVLAKLWSAGIPASQNDVTTVQKDCKGLAAIATEMNCPAPELASAVEAAYQGTGWYEKNYPDFAAACAAGPSMGSPRRSKKR